MSTINLFRHKSEVDTEKYIVVKYFLESKTTLRDAAWCLAIGQSIGNPNVRNRWETDSLFENHSCMILESEENLTQQSGEVEIGFPIANIDIQTSGISHLLCQIMGGQMDIDLVKKCHVKNISFPSSALSIPAFCT